MWLLENETLKHMQAASRSGIQPTAEQQAEMVARIGASNEGGPRLLTKVGNRAEISIRGVLTQRPNFIAMLFGGGNTTYPEIVSALAEADRDPEVDDIDLYFDTPGGTVEGLFDTVAAIQTTKTHTTAKVGNQAASAGYILAAVCDEVVAVNRASSVGSFGVAIDAALWEDVDYISITNTESPDKRPDIKTDQGRAIVRKNLDAYYELFAEAVAVGRKTTVDKINSDFGRGAMVLADEAVRRGMIDRVASASHLRAVPAPNQTAGNGGNEPEASTMDLKQLKAQHPDVYAAAVEQGKMDERDRVSAHLTMGEASGDMKTAITAITEGSEMTASLQAKYLAAGMNRADQSARGRESQEAAVAAAAGATADIPEGEDAGDKVCSLVEAGLGITGGAA